MKLLCHLFFWAWAYSFYTLLWARFLCSSASPLRLALALRCCLSCLPAFLELTSVTAATCLTFHTNTGLAFWVTAVRVQQFSASFPTDTLSSTSLSSHFYIYKNTMFIFSNVRIFSLEKELGIFTDIEMNSFNPIFQFYVSYFKVHCTWVNVHRENVDKRTWINWCL